MITNNIKNLCKCLEQNNNQRIGGNMYIKNI